MRRVALATALAAAGGLLGAEGAAACSCVPPNPPAMLKAADGAFIGRLVAVRAVDPPAEGEPIGSGDPVDFIYRVGRVFKRGPGLHRGRRVSVRSVRDGATCGLPRARGRLYGLFLQRRNRRWHSSLCLAVTPAALRSTADDASRGATASAGVAGCG